MAGDGKTLNQQNQAYISAYVLAQGLVLIGLKLGLDWNMATDAIVEKALTSTGWVLTSSVLATVANGQLSPELKARLVFWKFHHPLPGCEAFSNFMLQDPRIDPSVLRDRYGSLPVDSADQNRLWYKIYKKHAENQQIEDVHKKFLLTRDLSALAFLFLLSLSIVGYFLFDNLHVYIAYVLTLFISFLFFSQSARTYGESFVKNVLAEETST